MLKPFSTFLALAVVLIASRTFAIGAVEAPRADAAHGVSSIKVPDLAVSAGADLAAPALTMPQDLTASPIVAGQTAPSTDPSLSAAASNETSAAAGKARMTTLKNERLGQSGTFTELMNRNAGPMDWSHALLERPKHAGDDAAVVADGSRAAVKIEASLVKPSASEQVPSEPSVPVSPGGAALGGFLTTSLAAGTAVFFGSYNPAALLLGGMFMVFGMVYVLGAGRKIESVRQDSFLTLGAIMGLGGILTAFFSAMFGHPVTAAFSFSATVVPGIGAMALGGIPDRDLARIAKAWGARMRSAGSALRAFGRTITGKVLMGAVAGAVFGELLAFAFWFLSGGADERSFVWFLPALGSGLAALFTAETLWLNRLDFPQIRKTFSVRVYGAVSAVVSRFESRR